MSYFRNVQNDGVWQRGGTFTFEYRLYYDIPPTYPWGTATSKGILTNENLDSCIFQSNIGSYLLFNSVYSIPSPDDLWDDDLAVWSWVGDTVTSVIITNEEVAEIVEEDKDFWIKVTVSIPGDTPVGEYVLIHASIRDEQYPTMAWTLTNTEKYSIAIAVPSGAPVWPIARPVTYEPHLVWGWNPITLIYEWMDIWDIEQGGELPGAALYAVGGGRYNEKMVTITNKGEIYYL